MNVFELRDRLVRDYAKYIGSFIRIRDERVTGIDERQCQTALQAALLAGYRCEPNPQTGLPAFAFRLHQPYVSGGHGRFR